MPEDQVTGPLTGTGRQTRAPARHGSGGEIAPARLAALPGCDQPGWRRPSARTHLELRHCGDSPAPPAQQEPQRTIPRRLDLGQHRCSRCLGPGARQGSGSLASMTWVERSGVDPRLCAPAVEHMSAGRPPPMPRGGSSSLVRLVSQTPSHLTTGHLRGQKPLESQGLGVKRRGRGVSSLSIGATAWARRGAGPQRSPLQAGVRVFPPRHRTLILVACRGIIKLCRAPRQADGPLPQALLHPRSRGPGIEAGRGAGLAPRVWRRGRRGPGRAAILGPPMRDGADAQRRTGLERTGQDVGGLARLRVAPLLQRCVGITGAVDHPIDLALAVVEAPGPRLEIAAGPRAGAARTNSPPAPPPQHQQRAGAHPSHPPAHVHERSVVPRWGKTLGDEPLRPAPLPRVRRDQPPLG
jgi:hypothetical protein